MNLTGIVLAGGKSSRMGSDKGLMDYKGKKLIEYPINLLSSFCSEIIISSNNDAYLQFGFPVVADEIEDAGPAAGLAAALKAGSNEWNLVLSCDVPFVNAEAIEYLISFAGSGLGAVPKHNGFVEPLIALYHRSFYEVLESDIASGNLQMNSIIDHPYITFVDFSPLLEKYPRIFDNFNSPGDLEIG
jgi:molybdenum cofactor guanylyltransferase